MKKIINKDLSSHCAFLALTEIGLGSLLHNFKVPLTGHLLSLNQVFILTRGTIQSNNKKSGAEISAVVAILKTLSPVGKKLTPMLAISMQGILFSLGTVLFGVNYFGLILGGILASLWAFVQPLLLVYLFFGTNALNVAEYYIKELGKLIPLSLEMIWYGILVFVMIKILLTIFLIIIAPRTWGETLFKKQQEWSQLKEIKLGSNAHKSNWRQALNDLLHPLFIISFFLSLIFLFLAQVSWSNLIWISLRPIAVGFIVFYLVRIFPLDKMIFYFESKGYEAIAKLLKQTLSRLKEKKDN